MSSSCPLIWPIPESLTVLGLPNQLSTGLIVFCRLPTGIWIFQGANLDLIDLSHLSQTAGTNQTAQKPFLVARGSNG